MSMARDVFCSCGPEFYGQEADFENFRSHFPSAYFMNESDFRQKCETSKVEVHGT